MSLEALIGELRGRHGLSEASIALLKDKNLGEKEWRDLDAALSLSDDSFAKRREGRERLDRLLDRGDAIDITSGRYARYLSGWEEISSEQALVRGRMEFAIEYVIALAGHLEEEGLTDERFIPHAFSEEEESQLRSIYEGFRAKDYLAAKIIERRTNHDIVAANTWVTIRAQQLGLDDGLMRRAIHFARTSADVNTNVLGRLYTHALGRWASSLAGLIETLGEKAQTYAGMACIARTHGQDGQLTTLGHIYGNLAEQLAAHAAPLLGEEAFRFDGKLAGAIGTDVDMAAGFPEVEPEPFYRRLVEEHFGLAYTESNDQDCTNARLANFFDVMENVGLVLKKAATDTWLYASRQVLAKMTDPGESGSSAMPQKANPFLAEGCEALMGLISGMISPIKEMTIAYREQGDLRRSITKREAFHPIMLSIIGIERLHAEIKKYEPNVIGMETEIMEQGPKIASSAVSTYLRREGCSDAYDRLKGAVMRPYVSRDDMLAFLDDLTCEGALHEAAAGRVRSMVESVMDDGTLERLGNTRSRVEREAILRRLRERNTDVEKRAPLLGSAVRRAYGAAERARNNVGLLRRYAMHG